MKKKTSVFILAILVIASSGGLERAAWSYDVDVFDLAARNDTSEFATDLGKIGSSPLFFKGLSIHEPSDVDYFTWTSLFDDTLQIDILFEDSYGDLDTTLRRSYITLDQSDSLTDNEQLIADVTAGESYLLKVYGYKGSVNSYDLGFTFLDKGTPGDGTGGGTSGGGTSGGGSTTDPPPVIVGSAANKLTGLLDYMETFSLDRTQQRFLVFPVQQALKELNAGVPALRVMSTLQNVVYAPFGYRGRGAYNDMVKHVKSATVDIMNVMSADAGFRIKFSLPRYFRAVAADGVTDDGQTSVGYDPTTGEVWLDAPAGTELTSINIDSVSGIFTGDAAGSLGGSFDNSTSDNIFKATFGSSFGSLSFGKVAQAGLAEQFLLEDLTIVGSLAGGGSLGDVDLIYVPEPTAWAMASLGLFGLLTFVRRNRRNVA